MKKKSKFQEMMEKAKDTVIQPKVIPAIPTEQLQAILNEVPASPVEEAVVIEMVKDDTGLYNSVEQKKENDRIMKEVLADEVKKAYNIYLNPVDKVYYKDTIQYTQNGEIISVTNERLGGSQALALVEIKRIFSLKLIAKKEGL